MADWGGYSPLLVGGRPLMSDGTLGEENMFSDPEQDWVGIDAAPQKDWVGISPPEPVQPSYDEQFLGRMQQAGAIQNPASADYAPTALANVLRSRMNLPGEVTSREQSRLDENLKYQLWNQGYDNAAIGDMTAAEYEAKRREFENDSREQQVYDSTTALRKALTSDALPPENAQDWPQEMFSGADNLGEPLNMTALKAQLKAAHTPKDETKLEDLGKKPSQAVGETPQLQRLEALRAEAYQRAQRGKLLDQEFTPRLREMESLKAELKAKYPDFANEAEFKAFDKETTKWMKRAANRDAQRFQDDVAAQRKAYREGLGGDFSGSEAGSIVSGLVQGTRSLGAAAARGVGKFMKSSTTPGSPTLGNQVGAALERMSDKLQYGNQVIAAANKQAANEQQYGTVRGKLADNLPGASSSLFQAAALSPAGMGGMTLGFGATTANDAYYQAKQEGLSEEKAAKHAIIQGGIEMGVMTLFNKLGKFIPGLEGKQGLFAPAAEKIARETTRRKVINAATRLTGETIEEVITGAMQQVDAIKTLPSLKSKDVWTTKGKENDWDAGFLSSPGVKSVSDAMWQAVEQTVLMMGIGEAGRASIEVFTADPSRKNYYALPREVREKHHLPQDSSARERAQLAKTLSEELVEPIWTTGRTDQQPGEGVIPNGEEVSEVRQGELQVPLSDSEEEGQGRLREVIAPPSESNANEGMDAVAAGGQDVPIGPAAVSSSPTMRGRSPDAVAEEAAASAVSSPPESLPPEAVAASSPVPSQTAPVAERQAGIANLGGNAVTTPASESVDPVPQDASKPESKAPAKESVLGSNTARFDQLLASGKTPLEALQIIQDEGQASKVSPSSTPAVVNQEKPNVVPSESPAPVAKPVAKAAKEPTQAKLAAPEVPAGNRTGPEAPRRNEEAAAGRRDYASEIEALPPVERVRARRLLNALQEAERELDEMRIEHNSLPADTSAAKRARSKARIDATQKALDAEYENLDAAFRAEESPESSTESTPEVPKEPETPAESPTSDLPSPEMQAVYDDHNDKLTRFVERQQETQPGDWMGAFSDWSDYFHGIGREKGGWRTFDPEKAKGGFLAWAKNGIRNRAKDIAKADHLRQASETEDGESVLDNLADRDQALRLIGANAANTGGVEITRDEVQKLFPGRPIVKLPDGWRVEIGDHHLDIKFVPEVKMSEKDWEAAERGYGVKFPPDVRRDLAPAGSFEILDSNGNQYSGLGLIQLAHNPDLGKPAMTNKLAHEALHLARRVGLLKPAEWDALVKQYSSPESRSQEEDVANARERFKPGQRMIWQRIKAFFRNLLTTFSRGKINALTGADVFEKMAGSSFWDRNAIRPDRSKPSYSMVWRDNILDSLKSWQNKGTPEQLKAHLAKTKGAKDEADWIGLDAFLSGTSSVTKADVEAFVKANQVTVEEVLKSSDRKFSKPAEAKAYLSSLGFEPETDWGFSNDADYVVVANQEWDKFNAPQGDTKFSGYQTPGGENYRELLLTLPQAPHTSPPLEGVSVQELPNNFWVVKTAEGQQVGPRYESSEEADSAARRYRERELPSQRVGIDFRSSHFDEPNVLVHVRFNDRKSSDGKKTLFIEEIQSDWHQQGRKKGYGSSDVPAGWSETNFTSGNRVPDAPFKQSWPLLAFKRMVQWASEHGYDQIAWTTGEMQAERYDLSKQVESLSFHRGADSKSFSITATRSGELAGDNIANDVPYEKLPDYVGKDLASKVDPDAIGQQNFSGLDLKVGGEGMKGFYDRILPSEVNKYVKPWGAKVGKTEIGGEPQRLAKSAKPVRISDLPTETKRDVIEMIGDAPQNGGLGLKNPESYGDHYVIVDVNGYVQWFGEGRQAISTNPDDLHLRYSEAQGPRRLAATEVHAVPITPSMRDSVTTYGQPMFALQYAGGERLRGRPDLAKHTTDLERRADLDDMHEEMNENDEPGIRAREVAYAKAVQRIADDYDGVKAEIHALVDQEEPQPLSEWQTNAANMILDREFRAGRATGNATQIEATRALQKAVQASRTEQARALGLRDPLMTPAERRREAIRNAILVSENPIGLLRALADMGVTPANIDDLGEDPPRAAEIGMRIRQWNAWHGGVGARIKYAVDWHLEVWLANILSAPKTVAANVASWFYIPWHYGPQRFVEASWNLLLRDPTKASFAEMKYSLPAMLEGAAQGVRAALMTIRDYQRGYSTDSTWQHTPTVTGPLGHYTRGVFSALAAPDALASTLVKRMEVGAQAYRIAHKEGLTGPQLANRISQLVNNPNSLAWKRAQTLADKLTFHQAGGDITRRLKEGLTTLTGGGMTLFLRPFFPFIKAGVNIPAAGFQNSPLGVITAAIAWEGNRQLRHQLLDLVDDYDRTKGSLTKEERAGARRRILALTRHIEENSADLGRMGAQATLAAAAMLLLLGSNDPDDPWITGSEDIDYKTKGRKAAPASSVKLRGQWVSYSRIEPFATALATSVDVQMATDSHRSFPQQMWRNLRGQVLNKSFLEGASDMIRILESKDEDERSLNQWIAAFSASYFVPNFVRSAGRAAHEDTEIRSIWGHGKELNQRTMRRALQLSELHPSEWPLPDSMKVEKDQKWRDVWGDTVPRPKAPFWSSPTTDFAWRWLAPVDVKSAKDAPFEGTQVIYAWNRLHPEQGWNPTYPPKSYLIAGKRKDMTDAQYGKFLEESGKIAKERVDNWINNPEYEQDEPGRRERILSNPTAYEMKYLRNIIADAHHQARQSLIHQDAESVE